MQTTILGTSFGYAAVVVYLSVREIYQVVSTTYREVAEYLSMAEPLSDEEMEEAAAMLPV